MTGAHTLHFAFGNPTYCFESLGLRPGPEDVFDTHDPLSNGPLLPLDNPRTWIDRRISYWAERLRRLPQRTRGIYGETFARLDRILVADRVSIWFADSLDDHLFFLWTLALLSRLGVPDDRVWVAFVDRASERPAPVRSLGVVYPEHVSVAPRPLEPRLAASARQLWDAVTAPTPERLLALLASPQGLPVPLDARVRFLLRRYPDRATELAFWDRKLLEACTLYRGKVAAATVGRSMTSGWETDEPDVPNDPVLFARLFAMGDSRLRAPLVELRESERPKLGPLVALTDTARRVLCGEASHVALNGIDDWVGGVHLAGARASPWWYAAGTVVRWAT